MWVYCRTPYIYFYSNISLSQLFNQFDAEGDGILDRDTLYNVSIFAKWKKV